MKNFLTRSILMTIPLSGYGGWYLGHMTFTNALMFLATTIAMYLGMLATPIMTDTGREAVKDD